MQAEKDRYACTHMYTHTTSCVCVCVQVNVFRTPNLLNMLCTMLGLQSSLEVGVILSYTLCRT